MTKWWMAALALSVASVAPVHAMPTAGQIAAAAEAEKRGEEMFAYDQAAWHASDRFQEDVRRQGISFDTLRAKGLQGYIVEPGEGATLLATFYGVRDNGRFAIARYTVSGSNVTAGGFVPTDRSVDLSPLALRLIDAREKAIAAMRQPDHGLCTQSPPNSLALPPHGDGRISVYILSSTTDANMYPAGGHYRFDFDADGKLIGERRFMKACFNLDLGPHDGKRPTALYLTHLLDLQPTEIHAFVSRNIPIRLMIATVSNRAVWGITDGHVEYVSDVSEKN